MGHAADKLTDRLAFRAPFLIVNPETHLTGTAVRQLALTSDALAAEYDIDTVFTAQYADVRMVSESTSRLTVTAQHMDPVRPGKGWGRIVPESIADAGARAVMLNHADSPLTVATLEATVVRARELGLLSIACAGTDAQARAVACLGPDIVICEATGDGRTVGDGDDVARVASAVRHIDAGILVAVTAGVSGPQDAARVLTAGADGTGGTSFIVGSDDRRTALTELFASLRAHRQSR